MRNAVADASVDGYGNTSLSFSAPPEQHKHTNCALRAKAW
jgi:hypothetical protein